MEADITLPHAGGLTCCGGLHNRRTLQRTHRFTYKQQHHAHQEHTMHLTLESPRGNGLFSRCGATTFALQIVAEQNDTINNKNKKCAVTTRHKVSEFIDLL